MKYLIDFHNHLSLDDINSHLTSIGGTVVKSFNMFQKTFLVEVMDEPQLNEDFHQHLIADDSFPIQLLASTIVSEPIDITTKPQLTISSTDPKDWWKNFVVRSPNFDSPTYDIPKFGVNNVVYILDSGVKLDHPEFDGRPVEFIYSFNGDMTDTNGHGTALASVITGKTCGISEATVKAVKIFHSNTPTLQSDLLGAFDALYQDFMNSPQEYAIVNCSWIIDKNSLIESKINELIANGMYFVCAAGNNGSPIENLTPAGMANTITIGSFDTNLQPCNFSNYTGDVSTTQDQVNHGLLQGWAPGENIYVALKNGTYGYMSGTSISSAIHSAVLAADLEVYNFDQYSIPINWTEENILNSETLFNLHHARKISLNRKDLLDLDDPKYANSENRITTLIQTLTTLESFKLQFFGVAHTGSKYGTKIFYPEYTEKLEILDDLPPNVEVTSRGFLKGIPPEVTEPLIQTINMIAYDKEQGVHPFEFKIYTLPSNYVISRDLPEDDPVLNLLLQANPCKPDGNPFPYCAPCYDNCGPFCKYNAGTSPSCPKGTTTLCQCD